MSSNIKPTIHFIFKDLFTSDEMRSSLISLLNAILDINTINNVEVLNEGVKTNSYFNKEDVIYIIAKTRCNKQINILLNLKNEYDIINQSLYNLSKMYCNQLESSYKYFNLNKIVCINILDSSIYESKLPTDDYHSSFTFKDKYSKHELTSDLEVHFIELNKVCTNKPIYTTIDAWAYFLKDPFSIDVHTVIDQESSNALKLSISKYKVLNDDSYIKERYELYREAELDENSRLHAHDIDKIKKLYSIGASKELIKSIYTDFSESDLNEIIKTCVNHQKNSQ